MSKDDGDQKNEVYVPGDKPASGKALENYHRFSFKQVKFLEAYAKNLGDVNKAAKTAGVAVRTVKESWLKEVGMQEEIARIQEAWSVATLRGTAEEAMMNHIELMEKMTKHLDNNAEDTETAAKVMNPLAKMSDTYLKATGKFNDDKKAAGATVTINIGDSAPTKTVVEVEGEEVIENDE